MTAFVEKFALEVATTFAVGAVTAFLSGVTTTGEPAGRSRRSSACPHCGAQERAPAPRRVRGSERSDVTSVAGYLSPQSQHPMAGSTPCSALETPCLRICRRVLPLRIPICHGEMVSFGGGLNHVQS